MRLALRLGIRRFHVRDNLPCDIATSHRCLTLPLPAFATSHIRQKMADVGHPDFAWLRTGLASRYTVGCVNPFGVHCRARRRVLRVTARHLGGVCAARKGGWRRAVCEQDGKPAPSAAAAVVGAAESIPERNSERNPERNPECNPERYPECRPGCGASGCGAGCEPGTTAQPARARLCGGVLRGGRRLRGGIYALPADAGGVSGEVRRALAPASGAAGATAAARIPIRGLR